MIAFTEHEKDPGFRQRAAALEPKLRAKIARDETIILGEIAAELGVSLDVADVWIALLAVRMGAAARNKGWREPWLRISSNPATPLTLTALIGDVSSGDLIVVGNFAGVCACDAVGSNLSGSQKNGRASGGMRRYGFHGLSHSYCAGRSAEMVDRRDCGS